MQNISFTADFVEISTHFAYSAFPSAALKVSWSACDHSFISFSPLRFITSNAAFNAGIDAKCVEISTKAAVKEMVLPGLMAVLVPVIVGFAPKVLGINTGENVLMGPEMLGGLLAGVTVSGVLMAIFQANAGGAWDNAKKMFEEGVEINGKTYYKGSEPHKAAVVGDTVGDPFKDTSGPSINILIKLMSVVSLVLASLMI